MLLSGLVLALYFWAYFFGASSLSEALVISNNAAIAAGISFISGIIFYLWSPQKYLTIVVGILFLVLLLMTGLLLIDTGLSSSPFIALWMILATFAPVLGWYGTSLILLGVVGYFLQDIVHDSITIEDGVFGVLTGLLPLVIGYLAWPAHVKKYESKHDRAYHELASELSAVSGQSEVVIAAIADGVISVNGKGEVQLINPAAQKMIGWGKSDALGLSYKSVLKLVDARDQAVTDANDPIQKALSTNLETSSENFSIVTADSGKKFLADITASPVGTATGSGLIIVFRDITKDRAAEREQAEFISTASHEMRTPVASIEGYLGLTLNPATATIDDKARAFITKAHEAAQHLGRLFQDLLDVTKADDGRLSNNPGIIDVVAFVHDIVLGQEQRATEKGLRINYKPAPNEAENERYDVANRVVSPMYYVKVDGDHLREVIGNLIENAIKYTKQGTVDVDVKGDDQSVTISIEDSGIGIPKEDIPHLFQKFYRVDNSDTREIGGTGLGLYLCRRLVETIGGKLWVESTYKRGSTFFVKLARIDAVTARQEIENAGEVSLADETPLPMDTATEGPTQPVSSQPATPQTSPELPVPPMPLPTQPPTVPSLDRTALTPPPRVAPPTSAVNPPPAPPNSSA